MTLTDPIRARHVPHADLELLGEKVTRDSSCTTARGRYEVDGTSFEDGTQRK